MRRIPAPYHFSHLSDVFTFGHYKGCTLSDVVDMCPSYIEWCIKDVDRFLLEDEVKEELHLIYPNLFNSVQFEQSRTWNLEHWMDPYVNNDFDDEFEFYDSEDLIDEPTFDRYNGSWAQDEMGYSDDDIDTIFDGDPDAYWNID